jgi:hypothetical protein
MHRSVIALSWRGLHLPAQVRAALVVAVIATRIVRFAEGLVERHFHRPLSLYLDAPLVPDLFRLLRSTVAHGRLALGCLAALALLAGLAVVTWRTLAYLERSLATPWSSFSAITSLRQTSRKREQRIRYRSN